MERYDLGRKVGHGSYGTVWKAANKESGEIVAIKKLRKKCDSLEKCLNLREVKIQQKMDHPYIMKLKESIVENNDLFLVFEYMEYNLSEFMKTWRWTFSELKIRNWCCQVFQALAYMHEQGYFHRDLKPANLLVKEDTIKIADFGLAREVDSQAPYTDYVGTRWYRAPELLLRSTAYGPAVDVWAMGAIMAQMFTSKPLFHGGSEADVILRICEVIGSPNPDSWAEGFLLADAMKYQFPKVMSTLQFDGCFLQSSASPEAIHLIRLLCSWNPRKRPTAAEALQHPFFQPPSGKYVPPHNRASFSSGSRRH